MHSWNVTPAEAIALQKQLRQNVRIEPYDGDISRVRYIAGADVSLNRFEDDIYAGIIVLSNPDFQVVERSLVKSTTQMPYIPGLLSFREAPALIECWEKLKTKPDILMVDGQGIAHPRRLGIASHIGVLLDIPTIGCAKSVLAGVFEDVGPAAGDAAYIHDKYDHEKVLGVAIRTKPRSKPVIISPGHKISIDESAHIVKTCVRGFRLPEPTRLAHEAVNMFRRGELNEQNQLY